MGVRGARTVATGGTHADPKEGGASVGTVIGSGEVERLVVSV